MKLNEIRKIIRASAAAEASLHTNSHLVFFKPIEMIEVFLFGIVLGLIPISLTGLFVTEGLAISSTLIN